MAKQSFSFGFVSTGSLHEIIVTSQEGREIAKAIFPGSSLKPCAFRLFGIEAEELLLMEPDRAKSLAMRYLRDQQCIEFAYYWNQQDVVITKSKSATLLKTRIKLISNVLFHFYLSAYEVKLLKKTHALKQLQPLCDSTVDHCSYSPDGWWAICCCKHDLDYEEGGVEADRKFFDECFYYCVKGKAGHFIAYTYYLAVRLFGRSHFTYRQKPNNRRTCRP